MTDLVVISLEAWDGVWRRNQHLISRLLRGDPNLRVLFVEPASDPLHDVRSGRRPRFGGGVRQRRDVQRGLWTLRPLKLLPRRLDRGVDRRFARRVARVARRLGMSEPVLWVNDPGAAEVSRLTGWPTLYDITDDWAVAQRPASERARVVAGEQFLLRHASQVVVCSSELVRRKSVGRPTDLAPIVLIPNAVDVDFYRQPTTRPADLPDGKVALYAGTLHGDRLDVKLCIETAQALAGTASVVVVGPNALSDADTRALDNAGVVLLGARPHEQVPAYLQHADVLLVPHVVNEFTDSLDPIKLYEYLATGRPAVSTPVAGFRDVDAPRIITVDVEEYSSVVTSTLRRSKPTQTHPEEALPDWSVRATTMRRVLGALTAGHKA